MILVPYKQSALAVKSDPTVSKEQHTPTGPLTDKLLSLDASMENILHNNTLSDLDKINEYTKILTKDSINK